MTDKLTLYNLALANLGQHRIDTLGSPTERRRILDSYYPSCVQFCLEAGMWNFAMRTAALNTSGAGAMNFALAFNKPLDFVHLFDVAKTASFDPPLVKDFIDQGAQLYASTSPLYIRYTSNDASVAGGNLSLWTMTFTAYVAHVLAAWSALRITGRGDLGDLMEARSRRYLLNALAIDSVPMLPGLRPFNAEARALEVEDHQAQPIDTQPFSVALGFGQAPPQAGGGGR